MLGWCDDRAPAARRFRTRNSSGFECGVIPDRIAPQLATLVSSPPTGAGWAYEIKLDGYRILARIERGTVRLFTRNGNDWTSKMPRVAKEIAGFSVENAWLDGEVVVVGDSGLPDFNALQNAFDGKDRKSVV